MLNQSFSLENLKIIHEIENRKGNYYKDFYSDNYHITTTLLSTKRIEVKIEKNKSVKDESILTTLLEEKEQLELLKDNYLETELKNFSDEINKTNFNLLLTPFRPDLHSKTIYTTRKDAPSFFAMKQLQYNVFRTFKVKQSNRYQIVKQVKTILEDNFPKVIVRTDIRDFYESVPQIKLLKLIQNNSLLSPKSISLIKNLLYNFNLLTDQLKLNEKYRKGIPRGVGISPFLAELYMRKIDEEIKNIGEVTYYGRYVDDIIVVITPSSKFSTENYLIKVKNIIEDKGLKIKDGSLLGEVSKTLNLNLLNNSNTNEEIGFLGYKFNIVNSKLKEVKLSDNKKAKYKYRIEKSIEAYLKEKPYNSKNARKLLIHRFHYLTKNSMLHQPKKGLIGIYYSNSLINNDCVCLKELDIMISQIVDSKLPVVNYPELNKRLKKFSFEKGFIDKKFYHINAKKKNIPELRSDKYKDKKPLMNNFEKIVDAWK